MRPSASADHFRFLDLAPVVSAETNKSNTKFGAERSSGPQTKNRPKIACCAQLSATPKRSQKNSGSVGKTPHVKMTSPWFNPSLGFAFFRSQFLGRVFEGHFHPGRNVWTMGRRDRHTVPVGTRPTETPLLFPSDGHTNRSIHAARARIRDIPNVDSDVK